MLPFIQDRDVLTITPLFSSLPRLGEVVAFIHPGSHNFTVHRVIRKRRNQYLLKGDSVKTVDGWLHLCDILGRVISVERSGQAVLFGLGSERIAIALLQRHRYMCNLVQLYDRFARRKKG
ncbi:Peptidase S24-like [Desulfofustis glycolicus DSM 9705]|uniref:Peptidase S24-like n=2 Tax=Desulfofustis glycolicus TaxID=51195 RepID=A0A1M5YN66_9BACT|nr:Peptidase S24-like [Desulfofustis glycolicus DSM 9705]